MALIVDDALFEKASALAEPGLDQSALIEECIKAFVRVKAAGRLAALGGQAQDIELAPRRRDESPGP